MLDNRAGPDRHDFHDVVWRPLPSPNSFEWTVQRLTQAIRFGVIAPGERLPPERELADRLKVGRETVREAIRALREAGLVRTTRGRTGGSFVTATHEQTVPTDPRQMGADHVRDVLALRAVLESGAVELAARRGLDAPARLELVACLEKSCARGSDRRVQAARLHLRLAAASGSPSLLSAVADVHTQLDGILAGRPAMDIDLDSCDVQHRLIVEAVLSGDPHAARAVMQNHCETTFLLVEGLIA